MADSLDKRAQARALVTLQRNLDGVETVEGFVLAVGKELVLLHVVDDFHLDGYRIVPRSQVERARHSAVERYRAAILRAEKVLGRIGIEGEIDLTDWNATFKSLKARGENVIVEDEREESEEFVIGRIERVNKKSAAIRGFDALGRWDAETTRFKYVDVTSVTFGGEYVTTFTKYLLDS